MNEGDHDNDYQTNKESELSQEEEVVQEQVVNLPDDTLSPTKWLSKQILETSQNDADQTCSNKESSQERNTEPVEPKQKDMRHKRNDGVNEGNHVKTDKTAKVYPTTSLSKDIVKKCLGNKFKNYKKNASQVKKLNSSRQQQCR